MSEALSKEIITNWGAMIASAYHHLPVTPANTRAVRAAAWAVLGNVLVSDHRNGWNKPAEPGRGRDLLDDARLAVGKALELDPESALAHYADGLICSASGKPDDALVAFDKAIEYNCGFARAYAQKGSALINKGRLQEALKQIIEAIRLSPNDPSAGVFYWNRGRALFFWEKPRYGEAITAFTEARRLRPNLWYTWLYLVSAYALTGEYDEARSTLQEFIDSKAIPNASDYTIATVISHEEANPCTNGIVARGRERFHEGLKKAGMSQG